MKGWVRGRICTCRCGVEQRLKARKENVLDRCKGWESKKIVEEMAQGRCKGRKVKG